MKKSEIVIQRKIGTILTKLDAEDRNILEEYMGILESFMDNIQNTSKPKIETGVIDYSNKKDNAVERVETSVVNKPINKAYGSKFFSEQEIHFEMFAKMKGQTVKDHGGFSLVIADVDDIVQMNRVDYSLIRNRALSSMNNRRKLNLSK